MADASPIVEARDVAVRYPGAARDAVRDVSLALRAGERVGILGPSGCGKSTFALALAGAIPALVPGELRGTVVRAGAVAHVQQDVEAQLVALSVEGEIAFALENRGLDPGAIDVAIAQALGSGPARGLNARDATLSLSTGWRQRLALAAALAEGAGLTILDEPTAHLDEAAAQEAIAFMAGETPGALLLIEHRADLVAPLADRLLVLDREGAPLLLAPSAEALETIAGRPDLGLRLPPAARAALCLRRHGQAVAGGLMPDLAALVHAAAAWPADLRAALRDDLAPTRLPAAAGDPLVTLEAVSLRRGDHRALEGVSLTLRQGEVVGLAGGNGAGKTSLCLVAAGALRPGAGRRIAKQGLVAHMVPQNPALVFASASLGLEARRRGLAWHEAAASLESFGLTADPRRHPLHHSRGELRRIALAFALAGPGPMLAVLDEPTAGLDAHGLAALEASLLAGRAAGNGALVVSHDTDWLARTCDRILVLDAGRLAAEGAGRAICRRALDGTAPLAAPPAFALAAALGLETAA
ncbi:ABC transporter ATP-binding protein [uncultured Alsobacter sp.]|uniref:ATP-binding cassette domain-containing protein n=1 Tax=uncultured Alsobacter sp. TaxID=1748258 RepID=UPI0025DD3DCA|nr:ABC transporter ATP-binding protein [uncultured Alsobacter sp.]